MDLQTYMKLDAIDIAELIRMNEMTSADFLELAFRRLNEVNSDLNAVVHDRKSRAVIEAKRNHGSQMFSGVPMLLKNLSQAVAGEYITSSSKLMKNMISEHDSNFVSRLRDAGFVFIDRKSVV